MKKRVGCVLLSLAIALACFTACGSSEGGKPYQFSILNTLDFTVTEVLLQKKDDLSKTFTLYEGTLLPGTSVDIAGTLPEDYARDGWTMNACDIDGMFFDDIDGSLTEIAQLAIYQHADTEWVDFQYNAADAVLPADDPGEAAQGPYVGTWVMEQGTLVIHEDFRWELTGHDTDEYDESGDYYFDDDGILTLNRENSTYYEVTLDGGELIVEYSGGGSLVFTREA